MIVLEGIFFYYLDDASWYVHEVSKSSIIHTNKSPKSTDNWYMHEIAMRALNCWNDGHPTLIWLFHPLYTPPSPL